MFYFEMFEVSVMLVFFVGEKKMNSNPLSINLCQPVSVIQIIKTKYIPLQDLKARLKEEISRMQSSITDQRSEDNKDRTPCELEVTSLRFT